MEWPRICGDFNILEIILRFLHCNSACGHNGACLAGDCSFFFQNMNGGHQSLDKTSKLLVLCKEAFDSIVWSETERKKCGMKDREEKKKRATTYMGAEI